MTDLSWASTPRSAKRGDLGGRSRLGHRRVQREMREGGARRAVRLPADRNDRHRAGGRTGVTTYEGLDADGGRRRVLGGRVAVRGDRADSRVPSHRGHVALWQGGAGDATGPILLDLGRGDPPHCPVRPRGLLGPDSQVGTVKFSPDGSLLYASGFGPTFVFDTATGEKLGGSTERGFWPSVPTAAGSRFGMARWRCASSTPSGVEAPSRSRCHPFHRWPTSARRRPARDRGRHQTSWWRTPRPATIAETLHEHDRAVTAVEFRPSGDLVTAGADGAIITWDLGDWSEGIRTDGFVQQSASVELDERTVALELSDGKSHVVVAEPTAWEERACQIAGRILTEEEWGEILGVRPYAPACRD